MTLYAIEAGRVLVALPEATLLMLVQLRTRPNESVAEVIDRLASDQQPALVNGGKASDESGGARDAAAIELATQSRMPSTSQAPSACRYELVVLGDSFPCACLADGLARALRSLAELDETFLERFSHLGGRSRCHVASSPDRVHPGRSDLNHKYTREMWPGAGWWISTNYSRQDVRRILRAACDLVGLNYGADLVLREA